MSDVAIRVEDLGKEYRIGGKQEVYRTLRDSLSDMITAPFRRARSLLRGQAYGAAGLEETIWALKDVSFEVKHGEVVGIIGRNGAGKSTLLKILSRITEPTEGYADIYGRVGALLEVGTGFHPELTGRENVYLNGAILGMSREEIDRKFDEIVDFAEIEKFIDTPVKHYSSGMGLRLGFAVAAHLEPEILVVDEVLAVGDSAFQKKCLGKMGEAATQGRTVLFVSHNMAAVQGLCERGIVLKQSKLVYEGDAESAIFNYMHVNEAVASTGIDLRTHSGRRPGSKPVIRELHISLADGLETRSIPIGSSITFDIFLDPESERFTNCILSLGIFNIFGQLIVPFRSHMQYAGSLGVDKPTHAKLLWDDCMLVPGTYSIGVAIASDNKPVDWIDDAAQIDIEVDKDIYGTSKDLSHIGGVVLPRAHWSIDG